MKLFGVSPLSKQFLTLYPDDYRKRRINYKLGLIPPFYVDLPATLEDIVASDQKYLDGYDKYPRFTDIRYFVIAMYNILSKRARSA